MFGNWPEEIAMALVKDTISRTSAQQNPGVSFGNLRALQC